MSCFAHLRDSATSWISDVNELSVHIRNKRAEFAAEAARVAAASPPRRRRKSVTSSLSSNRTQKPQVERPSGGHRLKRFLSRESIRHDGLKRRRPTSPMPDDVDADVEIAVDPELERARTSSGKKAPTHIISYDGHTQKVLEKMVRDIWTAKSSIRSSRIQNSIKTAFGGRTRMQLPPPSGHTDLSSAGEKKNGVDVIEADQSESDNVTNDLLDIRRIMMEQRHRRYQVPQTALYTQKPQPQTRPKHCPYDFVEAQLDNVQSLCESAAYRFLRHGNCLDELEEILRAYELILEASTTMAEKEENAAANAEKEEQDTQKQAHDNHNDTVKVDNDKGNAAGAAPAMAPLKPKENDLDGAGDNILEVDDRSDTSDVSIDITAFRMTRYGHRTMNPVTVTQVP